MNGNVYPAYFATDVPVALCEILENVDYNGNSADDIESGRQMVIMLANDMTQKTQNFQTVLRQTNIDPSVVEAANLVNWSLCPKDELQRILTTLDNLVRNFLKVLQ